MRRNLLTLLSAFSLGLCVVTIGLWVRSYLPLDRGGEGDFGYFDRQFRHEYSSGGGEIEYTWWPHGFVHDEHPRYSHGFGYLFDEDCVEIILPYWFIVSLLVLAPAASTRQWMRRRNHPGVRSTGGFDIRVMPHRCPKSIQKADIHTSR